MAAVDRDAVVSVLVAPREGAGKFVGPNGVGTEGSPVGRNAAALRAMFKWQFGARSEKSSALDRWIESAMRCTESSASEYGFVRNASLLTHRRPRATLSAEVYPDSAADPA